MSSHQVFAALRHQEHKALHPMLHPGHRNSQPPCTQVGRSQRRGWGQVENTSEVNTCPFLKQNPWPGAEVITADSNNRLAVGILLLLRLLSRYMSLRYLC